MPKNKKHVVVDMLNLKQSVKRVIFICLSKKLLLMTKEEVCTMPSVRASSTTRSTKTTEAPSSNQKLQSKKPTSSRICSNLPYLRNLLVNQRRSKKKNLNCRMREVMSGIFLRRKSPNTKRMGGSIKKRRRGPGRVAIPIVEVHCWASPWQQIEVLEERGTSNWPQSGEIMITTTMIRLT